MDGVGSWPMRDFLLDYYVFRQMNEKDFMRGVGGEACCGAQAPLAQHVAFRKKMVYNNIQY